MISSSSSLSSLLLLLLQIAWPAVAGDHGVPVVTRVAGEPDTVVAPVKVGCGLNTASQRHPTVTSFVTTVDSILEVVVSVQQGELAAVAMVTVFHPYVFIKSALNRNHMDSPLRTVPSNLLFKFIVLENYLIL